MPPLKGNLARRGRLVDVGGAEDGIGGDALLDPADHGGEHVALGREGGIARELLPDKGGAGPALAVAHAADAEEAVKVVELVVGQAHGGRDVLVVARGVEARDDVVLLAVVVQNLGTLVLHGREVAVPGLDVEDVGAGEVGVVLAVERGRVPGGVVVDGVAHPVLGVGKGLARVVEVLGYELGAGLHGGEDEAVVLGVDQGGEDLADRLGLGLGEA